MSSNIAKRGALIDDTRQFVTLWDDQRSTAENLAQMTHENLLGLPTRSRSIDVTTRAMRPRFVDPGHDVVPALRVLQSDAQAFADACYFESCRADELLAQFAGEAVPGWYDEGRLAVTADLAEDWLRDLEKQQLIPKWSDSLRRRVAQGLLATLRDFGRLSGAQRSPNKELVGPGISRGGFAYVAYRLHEQEESSRMILSSETWHRWLLDGSRVEELMHGIAALGLVYYSQAGSSLRIDWRVHSLVEVARAVV